MTAPIIGTLLRVLDRTAAIAPMRNPISDKGIDAAMIAPASHETTPEPSRKGNTTVLTTGSVIPRTTDHFAIASILSFNALPRSQRRSAHQRRLSPAPKSESGAESDNPVEHRLSEVKDLVTVWSTDN